jgi:hypothetical protein
MRVLARMLNDCLPIFYKEVKCFCLPSVAMVLWVTIKSTFITAEIVSFRLACADQKQ